MEEARERIEKPYSGDDPLEGVEFYFNGSFNQHKVVDELDLRFRFMTVGGILYRYDDALGYYRKDGRAFIRNFTEKALRREYKRRHADEVVAQIMAQTDYGAEIPEPPIVLINLKNGIFDLDTWRIYPHDHKMFFTSTINVEYVEDAECPNFKKFVSEVTGNEVDLLTLQEWFGYCLYRDYPHQKALVLLGEGANGKSKFISVLERFLGQDNFSNQSLHRIVSDMFAMASLWHKHANLFSDLSSRAINDTSSFRVLTGGDTIDARMMHTQTGLKFTNYAKLTFSANRLPASTEDVTPAFFRRFLLVTFPFVFEGESADKKILDKLTTTDELNGILLWALEGLQRLLKNEDFSKKLTTDEIQVLYQRMSSSLYCFLEDETMLDPDFSIDYNHFYTMYMRYCMDQSLPKLGKGQVTVEMPLYRPSVAKRKSGEKGRPWMWEGIRMLSDEEKEEVIESQRNLTDFGEVSV